MDSLTQKILVVDNNPDFLHDIEALLVEKGHEVLCVDNVFRCLDLLASQTPDIIFLDYIMPHMDGDDLCRAIRNYDHLEETCLVIFSAIAMERPVDFYALGADACIAKGPFNEMRVHIEEVIAEAQHPGRGFPLQQLRGGEKLYFREVTSELLQQNSHYKALLQNLSQGIIEIVCGRVVYVNRSGAEMLNVLPEEVVGAVAERALPRGLLKLFEQDGKSVTPELDCGMSSPVQFNDRHLLVEVFAIHNGQLGNMLILSDITERKRMESVIEAANLTENLGYVFSGIRHEIGNPVNSIKMALSVLQRNLMEYDQGTIAEFLDRSLQEISRIEYLLKALKNYSLFESPVVQDIPVSGFLHDFVALVRNDFEQLGIRMRTILPDEQLLVRVDSRALHHVLLNLVTNSVDALKETPDPHIIVSSFLRGDMVIIKVDDNGKGIAESDMVHLFKPFFTSKSTGTGLGLAIVKKMLASMNGFVNLESYLGIGTTVTIQLPGAGYESQQENTSRY